jgi:hypothetical protein
MTTASPRDEPNGADRSATGADPTRGGRNRAQHESSDAHPLRDGPEGSTARVQVKISATRIHVFLFSTAGGPTTQEGTGMRVYDLAPIADGHENRSLNILFGFMHAAAKERVQILDACFLNPATLQLP